VNYPSKEAEKPHAVRGSERRRNGAYEVSIHCIRAERDVPAKVTERVSCGAGS